MTDKLKRGANSEPFSFSHLFQKSLSSFGYANTGWTPKGPQSWANRVKMQQLSFSVNKHGGKKTQNPDYMILGIGGYNLGVVDPPPKPSSQLGSSSPKCTQILVSISKDTENRAKWVTLQIHKKIVNPHSKYYVQFWSLYLKEDVVDSEKATEKAS